MLVTARMCTRVEMLDDMTEVVDHERRFVRGAGVRELSKTERGKVERAFKRYLKTLSDSKRQQQAVFYDIKDVVGRSGFGIGSAGLPAYNVLIEGFNQALENDVVLSMKQANVPAVSRIVDDDRVAEFFENEGHRTVVSQRELQVHTDPFLGWTTVDKVGYVVAEVSPYEADLDWSEITEPDEIEPVVELLGRATAKIHCVSDEDSDEDLVDFQTEEVDHRGDRRGPRGVRRRARRLRDRLRREDAQGPRPVRGRLPRGEVRPGEGRQPMNDSRTSRSGLSTLRSTRQIDCQVPSASRPPRTGIVAYGGTRAGITCERPCPGDPCRCRQRSSAGSRSARAASRSSSEPAPVSRIAMPAVACGTKTCRSPSPVPCDEVRALTGDVEDGLLAAGPDVDGLRLAWAHPVNAVAGWCSATMDPAASSASVALGRRWLNGSNSHQGDQDDRHARGTIRPTTSVGKCRPSITRSRHTTTHMTIARQVRTVRRTPARTSPHTRTSTTPASAADDEA